MNILSKVTWKAMWKNKTRTLVTVIGIILSAAMFSAVATLGVSLITYMIQVEQYRSGDYYVQIDYGSDQSLYDLREDPSVSRLGDLRNLGYVHLPSTDVPQDSAHTFTLSSGDEMFFDMVSVHLESGRLPENDREIVIPMQLHNLAQELGLPCEIGESLKLETITEYAPSLNSGIDFPATDAVPFAKEYEIVGITKSNEWFRDPLIPLSDILTYADQEHPALWHRFYAKTKSADAAYQLLDEQYGVSGSLNYNMLNLHGGSKYFNLNSLIRNLCATLMVIIMVGSGSLIYNAFSISVAERTKQFGLLSSIGATRKQLRRSVYFEALSLCGIGIPIGILCGYAGIAVTLYFTQDLIGNWMYGAADSAVTLKATLSIPAFIAASVIALVTVFLSCSIPAKRAKKIVPIEAIRQTQEYHVPKKNIRVSKLTAKLFGLPGILGKKYYTVSKRKYRATIFSITVTLVLFLSAFSFSQNLTATIGQNANTDNYDIDITFTSEEELEQLRSHPAVTQSAVVTLQSHITAIPEEAYTDGYKKIIEKGSSETAADQAGNTKYVHLYYLEDSVFKEYLRQHGIDPAPYFDAENPTALIYNPDIFVYQTDGSKKIRNLYKEQILKDDVESVTLYQDSLPEDFSQMLREKYGQFDTNLRIIDDRIVYRLAFDTPLSPNELTAFPEVAEDGNLYLALQQKAEGDFILTSYHAYHPNSKTMSDTPLWSTQAPLKDTQIGIGEAIDDLPFGIMNRSRLESIILIAPLSSAELTVPSYDLAVTVSDYKEFINFLKENDFPYYSLLESQMSWRDYITIANVFCYGFIALISLICICNVFNTINTNIALRRRDFGMLRSVGMKDGELHKMMALECLQYCTKSMIYGLPLALLSTLGIHYVVRDLSGTDYQFPLLAVIIAMVSICILMFITMLYSVSKLRKTSPIDAIRAENL